MIREAESHGFSDKGGLKPCFLVIREDESHGFQEKRLKVMVSGDKG